MLAPPIFENGIPIPSHYTTFVAPLNDITLHASSNAVDAGVLLPNINDNFDGNAPDMGARFRPTQSGLQSAVLVIPSSDPDENPVSVPLSGTGV